MDWNAMSPRERDALVAEKVMDWEVRYVAGQLWMVKARFAGSTEYPSHWPLNKTSSNENVCPSFTTDIAAAWEVVEKMEATGWRMGLQNGVQHPKYGWRADFHDNARPFVRDGHHVAGGTSAADAICRCALRAWGVEV